MELLIIVACTLAVVSASYPYYGLQHNPIIAPDGVPVDTPEVQAGKRQHLAPVAKFQTDGAWNPTDKYGHGVYSGPLHIPVTGSSGVSVETPEVQAAKSQHLAALAQAESRNVLVPADRCNDHSIWSGPQHIPIIGPNGVPIEIPVVQAARAQHLAAYSGHYNTYGDKHHYF